jgi:peroxiredoxin
LRDAHSELDRSGVAVALVTFGDPEATQRFCAAARVPFPCYADPDRRGYDAFGLERQGSWHRVLDPRQARATLKALRRGHAMYKGRLSVRQMPGTFLIDTAGEVRYAHRNRYPADNPTVEALLAAARSVSARA